MNILITGGAGFIGSHLTKSFLNSGNNVWVIDNLITGNKDNLPQEKLDQLTFIEHDVMTYDLTCLPHFDIVFHLASPASPIQYKKHPVETLRVNAEGTHRLLQMCQTNQCGKFVMASTSEVYGDPLEHPQKETYWGNVNSIGERACYDEAKRYAEAITMTYFSKHHIDVRIARIFNTYGPHMELHDGRVVSNFIVQALQNEPITVYGKGDQTRSFCYVDDLVQGLIALGTTEDIEGEVINLGNPDERTVLELAELIINMTDSKSEIVYEPIGEDDPKQRRPDITKAKKLLKWQPSTTLETGLERAIVYFEHQILKKSA